jgi:CO/xanthine dehydrogenase Mo-binding subunit
MGKTPDEWSYGDIDAGFKNAALVLDETFVTPDTSHQPLETRSALAYWQNGKVYVHTGTQSTAQTVPAIARWLNIDGAKLSSSANIPEAAAARSTAGVSRLFTRSIEEGQCAGDDADQPEEGIFHRARAAQVC